MKHLPVGRARSPARSFWFRSFGSWSGVPFSDPNLSAKPGQPHRLALAVLTLTAMLLGQGWIATALGQPAMLIALLTILCGVILAAAVAIARHADVLAYRLANRRAHCCSRL